MRAEPQRGQDGGSEVDERGCWSVAEDVTNMRSLAMPPVPAFIPFLNQLALLDSLTLFVLTHSRPSGAPSTLNSRSVPALNGHTGPTTLPSRESSESPV